MARPKKPFIPYKRFRTKTRYTYYVRVRHPVTGDIHRTIATPETSRDAAIRYAQQLIADEEAVAKAKEESADRSEPTVAELARGFWRPDGAYAVSRRARGKSISNGHLSISEGYTRNHILPVWGQRTVASITGGEIDKWVVDMYQRGELAGGTINKLLQNLRNLLNGAVRDGYIATNPASAIEPVVPNPSERGILTDDEVRRLFADPAAFADHRHYAINLLAFTTGIRMGEVRGLTLDHCHGDRVEIVRSWEQGYGLKAPKYESYRALPITPAVYEALERVVNDTRPQELVFFSRTDMSRPMSKSTIEQHLYRALTKIGIDDEQRRERAITFHSWRHKLNTLLRSAAVPESKIRIITGHRNEAMTDWYTRYRLTDFTDVMAVPERVLLMAA